MELLRYVLILYILEKVSLAKCIDDIKWQNDVYTGRHFNALITMSTETDGFVINPTVLFMYTPECSLAAFAMVKFITLAGPSQSFLTIAKHDYETTRKHIWYNSDDIDDLKKRYILKGDACLKVLFFQTGFHLTDPFVWDAKSDDSILLWVWSFFGVNLGITNSMIYSVTAYAEGNGDKQLLFTVEPGKTINIHSHFSRAITFYDPTNRPIYAFPITDDLDDVDWMIDVKPEVVDVFIPWKNDTNNYWLRNMRNKQYKSYLDKLNMHWKNGRSRN